MPDVRASAGRPLPNGARSARRAGGDGARRRRLLQGAVSSSSSKCRLSVRALDERRRALTQDVGDAGAEAGQECSSPSRSCSRCGASRGEGAAQGRVATRHRGHSGRATMRAGTRFSRRGRATRAVGCAGGATGGAWSNESHSSRASGRGSKRRRPGGLRAVEGDAGSARKHQVLGVGLSGRSRASIERAAAEAPERGDRRGRRASGASPPLAARSKARRRRRRALEKLADEARRAAAGQAAARRAGPRVLGSAHGSQFRAAAGGLRAGQRIS